jgi:hypothetical protein
MLPDDHSGIIAGFRRMIWPALFVLLAGAIAIGIVLSTTKAAH